MTPTFGLSDVLPDHLEWMHDCVASFGTPFRNETVLPLGPNGWQIVQAEPLTVTPSILCRMCGCHGFITNGEWVPA